jgi:N6-L-threonylcarbamoyladenine synthase
MNYILGLDSSCYTTSLAGVGLNGNVLFRKQLMLDVPLGKRGLQQSDAIFQHLRNLPLVTQSLRESIPEGEIMAVCASCRPRPQEGSYMPVFLFSHNVGQAIADLLKVPFYLTSHQENHIMAGVYTAKGPCTDHFLAIHISGGTTELLNVRSLTKGFNIDLIGSSTDLSAGQLVDRVGVAMGLPFPAGPHLEALSQGGTGLISLNASMKGLNISFSGPESQVQRLIKEGHPHSELGYAVYDLLIRIISKWISKAVNNGYPDDVLMVGGVSSSQFLRQGLIKRLAKKDKHINLYFAEPALAKDNAVGSALIGLQNWNLENLK